MIKSYLEPTPWDQRNFPVETYQLSEYSEAALRETDQVKGHFTVKVGVFENTKLLHDYGFYYADTLIAPFCKKDRFLFERAKEASFTENFDKDEILNIAEEAFQGGRYHRDFNIPNNMADKRYRNWVKDLINQRLILAYKQNGEIAGFFAYKDDQILLLAMHEDYRGKGMATAFAGACVKEQFVRTGHTELKTSISPSNPASLNVFLGLGFRLGPAIDVYHKLNGTIEERE
ncbi:GNAT family N-acetyltransferase [Oceanobacillus kimchii]|uniref:N-acetyltransferase domain-containing protein n=1 Tax=Oceanobacillus kimchii TaxID=746691 RepID=A0ABQ5TJN6_9BACI|nr:GNAT family N-acetyltransferase [Oceanobacillus kimchii]GLO67083.1 hypothetical protein MACH08_28670 [Oceanobacillus kimchii]